MKPVAHLAVIALGLFASRGLAENRVEASPETYGTGLTYATIDASQLSPLGSSTQYGYIYEGRGRYLINVSGLGFMAPLHLPAGARLASIIVYGRDASATGEYQAAVEICDGPGQTCFTAVASPACPDAPVTVCSGNGYDGGDGYVYASLYDDDIVVDNVHNRYVVVAGNTTNDNLTSISRIEVGYVLQVSPPPATATFQDVPTADPAFQFIEAIAASGITAGCGGGNYCPDQPVTRRQMAVFLAKALGLQWN
jgi:hypothetical protein